MVFLFHSFYIPWYSAQHIVGTPEIYDQVMDWDIKNSQSFQGKNMKNKTDSYKIW